MDRNAVNERTHDQLAPSLSARRAWIEIPLACTDIINVPVALRKESVDRNLSILLPNAVLTCRSPQGERG